MTLRRFLEPARSALARSRSATSNTGPRQAWSDRGRNPRARSISISGMLTLLPRSSPAKPASLLIAAISARARAASAIRGGSEALGAACLGGRGTRGLRWQSLGPALEALAEAAPSPILGLVYGSGFEDRPHLLTRIAERWPVLGNDAATIERIKAPESFFAALHRLGIAHPLT